MEPALFNNETCSCECDTSLYNRDETRCESLPDRHWDPITCTCRRVEEGLLLPGPSQENEARKAAEAAGEEFDGDGRHHHHKVRPLLMLSKKQIYTYLHGYFYSKACVYYFADKN